MTIVVRGVKEPKNYTGSDRVLSQEYSAVWKRLVRRQLIYPVGGKRIGNADRKRIIEAYQQHGKEAADAIAVGEFGLSERYAYQLMNSRGLLPRRGAREDNI